MRKAPSTDLAEFEVTNLTEFGIEMKSILTTWQNIIIKYSRNNVASDCLYWYNERATLSTFAGACWINGCSALEEFSSWKEENGRKYRGRVDLWFECNAGNYLVEAKQSWPQISAKITNKAFERIEVACKDAIKTFNSYNEDLEEKDKIPGVALHFFTPSVDGNTNQSGCTERIVRYLQRFTEKFKDQPELCDFWSYVFPAESRMLSGRDKRIYPGVALIGRLVR